MPFAVRNNQGNIIALVNEAPQGHTEQVSLSDPEVMAFMTDGEVPQGQPEADPEQALAKSDLEIVRVTEDIIQLLIHKNIILFTDLPNAVQSKLLNREKLRSSMQGMDNNFLDDSDSI